MPSPFLDRLLRPRILAAVFGGYVLLIAVIAAWFADGPGSAYRYTPGIIQWSFGVYSLLGGVFLFGMGLMAAAWARPWERARPAVEEERGPEPAEDPGWLPPPLESESLTGEVKDEDIDDLLSALGAMESTLEAEEGLEVLEVVPPTKAVVKAAPRGKSAAASAVARSPTRFASVGAYFLGPALLNIGVMAVSVILLPGADAFLQTFNQFNTAVLLGIAYSYPGIALYTGLTLYALLTHPWATPSWRSDAA
jgi:hypothetical protein